MRFVGDSSNGGLESDTKSGGAGLSHQFDPRNSLGTNYSYASYNFLGSTFGVTVPNFISQTASLAYSHQVTRKLGINIAAGPQWTSVNSPNSPQGTSLFADASAAYAGRFAHASLGYVRSTNGGFGVTGGALSDGVEFAAGRTFAVVWNCSFSSAYTRSSTLATASIPSSTFDTVVVGGQISRAIARSLSGYASYTLERQSTSSSAGAVDVFSGLSQVVGFGVTYSPSALRIGRR